MCVHKDIVPFRDEVRVMLPVIIVVALLWHCNDLLTVALLSFLQIQVLQISENH
jgi:hypothetical protein